MTAALRERPSTGTRLRGVLLGQLAENRAQLIDHAERAWASPTFSGGRHTIRLRFTGAAAIMAGERFIAALPEHEFAMRGALVAEAEVIAVRHHAAIDPPFLDVTTYLLVLDED